MAVEYSGFINLKCDSFEPRGNATLCRIRSVRRLFSDLKPEVVSQFNLKTKRFFTEQNQFTCFYYDRELIGLIN